MADIYGPIDAVYKQMYADNVKLQVQLLTDPFESAFETIPGLKGREMQAVDLVGKSEALVDAPDSSPTPNIPPKHEGIYVQPRRLTWGRSIPKSIEVKAAVDYTSNYVREASAAIARGRAAIISAAITGPRLVRNDATGAIYSVPFDAADQTIANNYQYGGAGATSGLTVQKFIKAMEKIGITDVDVDAEDMWCMMTFHQNTDLYQAIQVTNRFYVDRAQFDEKRVTTFMGVKIRIYNYLGMDTTGAYRQIPMWAKSGVHMGDAVPLETFIERNPAMQFQPQIFLENWMGATRSEDQKVALINCDETVN